MSNIATEKYVIHPAIGIARVGNSPDEYFIGPEAPGVVPDPKLSPEDTQGFKDAQGRIKRQAARFRIYQIDATGKAVKEMTARDGTIKWTVHVANRKSAWYTFNTAMDIPGACACTRRNATVIGHARKQLIIDPGKKSVTGPNQRALFNNGTFRGVAVPLGEMQTDAVGRLLVLGGFGRSGSLPAGPATTYGDNDNWYDDTSDGPVSATITIGGIEHPVTSAWVIVAPPDYAPEIQSVVTLYDVVYEAATKLQTNKIIPPEEPSFTDHIYPILRRMTNIEWVNEGFYLEYGFGSDEYFLNPEKLRRLANNSAAQESERRTIFEKFRNPAYTKPEEDKWPPIYGDAMTTDPPLTARNWLAVTQLQYEWLKKWAGGKFKADWKDFPQPKPFNEIACKDRPAALDRAALEASLGGPFHPGCEATWPMRIPLLYAEPFRIKEHPGGPPRDNYGPILTPETAISSGGPLDGSGPGDLTRWMAVPWQTDTASCRSGYTPAINPTLPTFWPARVPNQVIRERCYLEAMNPSHSESQRQKYFSFREDWLRDLPSDYDKAINQFILEWYKFGILVKKRNTTTSQHLPAELYVETENEFERQHDGRHKRLNPRTGQTDK